MAWGQKPPDSSVATRVFLIGLTGFALASALGGASGKLATLLLSRAIQGAFAALLRRPAVTTADHEPVKPEDAVASGCSEASPGRPPQRRPARCFLILTHSLSWRGALLPHLFFCRPPLAGGALLLAGNTQESSVPG